MAFFFSNMRPVISNLQNWFIRHYVLAFVRFIVPGLFLFSFYWISNVFKINKEKRKIEVASYNQVFKRNCPLVLQLSMSYNQNIQYFKDILRPWHACCNINVRDTLS